MTGFWEVVDAQLAELRTAKTQDDVIRILANERDPYGNGGGGSHAFFAGGGGDDGVMEALGEAGWKIVWANADYHFAMRAPDGTCITYTEGDIYRGDGRS